MNWILQRPAAIGTLVAATAAAPYGYQQYSNERLSAASDSQVAAVDATAIAAATPVTNASLSQLWQFVRFDVTPGWVLSTFPRVSTVLANVQFDGLRVPFVTGVARTDLAGTVDYYFDRGKSLRRICLQSRCGDPSGVAQLLQQYYGMRPEPSLGGHLYTIRWNNRVTSVAVISPAAVVQADDDFSRFDVYLELNVPSADYGLSERAEQLLQTAWQNLRWQ